MTSNNSDAGQSQWSRRAFGRACVGAASFAAAAASGATARAQAMSGTIRFSWWGGPARNAKTNAVCDLFEKKYPGIKVAREVADWQPYWDKLSVQAAGGNLPQAVQMQSRTIDQYAKGGALRPLDDLVQQGLIDLSDIEPTVLATGRQADGKLYMAPYGVFNIVETFNRTVMEQAGVATPRFDWTWDDFVSTTKALQKKLPRGTYATALLGGEVEPFFPWIVGHGEPVFTDRGLGFSKGTLIAWYQMWEDLRKSGVTYSAEVMSEVHRSSIEDAPLALNKVVMDVKPANQLQAHQDVLAKVGKFVLDIQKQPSGPKGPGEVVGANGISISAKASPQDVKMAAAFIQFFLRDEAGAKAFDSDNGVVSVGHLQEQQIADSATSYGARRSIELLRQVLKVAKPEVYPHYYQALAALQVRNYQAVAFETMSIEKAADQYFVEADQIVKA